MRILLFFGTFVLAMLGLTDLASGNLLAALGFLAAAGVGGWLLWRDLKDPEKTRKAGERAIVTFTLARDGALAEAGTFARLKAHKRAWDIVLDRRPEPEDFKLYDFGQSAWVWFDADGLPERVRMMRTHTIQRWPVLEATEITPSEGSKR